MKLKKLFCFFISFLLLTNLFITGSVKVNAINISKVNYSVDNSSITVGQTFNIMVNCQNINDLYGASVDFKYDATMLEIVDITEGDAFKNSGMPYNIAVKTSIPDTTGIVSMGLSLQGMVSGFSGNGKLFVIKAKALKTGLVNLNTTEDFSQLASTGLNMCVKLANSTDSAKINGIAYENLNFNITEPIVSVTGVSLDRSNASLNIGDKASLIPTITPVNATNNNLTWTTSNPQILTVDNLGNVTAVSNGTATITVTTADGNKTAICVITVAAPAVKLPSVSYSGHVQDRGWQDPVKDGELAGTEGQSLRVEAFKINLENAPVGLTVNYQAHVQNIGWKDWVYDGAVAGTEGKSLRVEALKIILAGTDASKYSIEYQAHVQNEGWQPWVRDGKIAGTFGKSLRIEAIRIRITKKFPSVYYEAHVQNTGWQVPVKDGVLAGTEGKSLRVEAFKIKLQNAPEGLKIKYVTHIQYRGWQDWVYDGEVAGTEGLSLRVEALQIMLEGTDADKYSIVYQAHVQNEGWQPWVKDGALAGSIGKAQRIEAIRINIVKK